MTKRQHKKNVAKGVAHLEAALLEHLLKKMKHAGGEKVPYSDAAHPVAWVFNQQELLDRAITEGPALDYDQGPFNGTSPD